MISAAPPGSLDSRAGFLLWESADAVALTVGRFLQGSSEPVRQRHRVERGVIRRSHDQLSAGAARTKEAHDEAVGGARTAIDGRKL